MPSIFVHDGNPLQGTEWGVGFSMDFKQRCVDVNGVPNHSTSFNPQTGVRIELSWTEATTNSSKSRAPSWIATTDGANRYVLLVAAHEASVVLPPKAKVGILAVPHQLFYCCRASAKLIWYKTRILHDCKSDNSLPFLCKYSSRCVKEILFFRFPSFFIFLLISFHDSR